MSLLIKGVTAHTGLTDKEVAGVIDHAALSVSDAKIASGVGTADTQLLKLPVAADGLVIKRTAGAWGAGSAGISGVKVRINSQMPVIGTRPQLNFIEGAAIGLQLADNPSDDEIDVFISAKYPTQYMTLLPENAVLPTVNPAALASVDGGNFSYECLDFDPATEESTYWEWFLTPDYLSENIVVDIYWITTDASAAHNAVFGFSTLGRQKTDPWDAALGVERTVVCPNGGAGVLNKARITTFAPGWSPGDVLMFKLARKAADVADTVDVDARVVKVVVSYTGQFAQAFYPLTTPVELTPTVGSAWTDMDVSGYVPAGATGVILHIENTTAVSGMFIGLRKKGSTDDLHDRMFISSHLWAMTGVDENRIFQYYVESAAVAKIWLVGYTATGVVFFDNAVEKVPGFFDSWQDIDVSAECPGAIGVIVEMQCGFGHKAAAVRKNGSALNTSWGLILSHIWAVAGCDGAQIFETYLADATTHLYIIGYITEGAVFPTNGINKTPGVIDSWQTVDCSAQAPAGIMLFFQAEQIGLGDNYGVRKHGSTENILRGTCDGEAYAFVACDSGQKVDVYTHFLYSPTNVGLFLMGYATWAAP